MRTDQEIVDQTNELALLLTSQAGLLVPEGHKFYEAEDPRSVAAWKRACEIQELMTHTDPENALSNLEPEEDAPKRKFSVRLEEKVYYSVEVEAVDADQAEEDARELWAQSQDPTHDFCGEGIGVSVVHTEAMEG